MEILISFMRILMKNGKDNLLLIWQQKDGNTLSKVLKVIVKQAKASLGKKKMPEQIITYFVMKKYQLNYNTDNDENNDL